MHYYKFNIGDYHSHTSHLEPIEDIAYRRMIDWCYLHERQLPSDHEEIARLIRMRTHCDCIAIVLREFFVVTDSGYFMQRIEDEVDNYKKKSTKAKESANARWRNKAVSDDANALLPDSARNAKQEPLTTNHKTIIKKPLSLNPNDVVELFNNATNFPKVKVLSDSRKKSIKKLLNEMPTIDAWGQFFAVANKSDFLSGRSSDWQANFDWLIKPANAIKVLEGNYTNKIGGSNGTHKNAGRKNAAESHHDTLKQIAAEADEREMGGGDFQ